jgi:hypothetical protein
VHAKLKGTEIVLDVKATTRFQIHRGASAAGFLTGLLVILVGVYKKKRRAAR